MPFESNYVDIMKWRKRGLVFHWNNNIAIIFFKSTGKDHIKKNEPYERNRTDSFSIEVFI